MNEHPNNIKGNNPTVNRFLDNKKNSRAMKQT